MLSLNFFLNNKEYINNYNRDLIKHNNFYLYFISSTFIELITYFCTLKIYNFAENNIIYDLFMFIPISFLYEIVFDFFHYIFHKFEHENSFLYKNIHKIHHTTQYPTVETTYMQHPIDLILTNSIPQFLTLLFIPKISLFMLNIIIIFKVFIEISGHSGKIFKSTSFSQFVWLPRFFRIELRTEDHDKHHTLNNCNYSKRFKLWDKMFGTYK